MKFNWNCNILANFLYIFIHIFETIYARSEKKLSPERAFYKLYDGVHYVGINKEWILKFEVHQTGFVVNKVITQFHDMQFIRTSCIVISAM